ncbi:MULTISPECIES: hypothetical protein [unclassified Citrobacter]|uniref:hypothetical protein n=1 Tax=unclassified Citrobacter TaxID=2644389 RepID=UPI001B397009|nr:MULTISPECIES: hypothetical protein [unclassified Citrobacter]MBP8542001.1 hypothetical protein [Citrobacter sp. On2M]MBP8543491.1 hypothetical protein [Citrobacter sp. On2M]MBW5274236.1 hypothetical protein [Citrobacter sp. On28M]
MIIPENIKAIGSTGGNSSQSITINSVAANGRPFGTPFVLSQTSPAFVTYSIDQSIPSDVGGQATITATVDGVFVSGTRNTEVANSGEVVAINRREVISFFVPPGSSVSLGRSLSTGVTAALAGGQEVIFK